jgi:PAS domain S-box-containing protein
MSDESRSSPDERSSREDLLAEVARLREQVARLEAARPDRDRIVRSIVDNMVEGVAVADRNGRLILFNPAAERVLGMGTTDADKERWSDVYGTYHVDRVTPFETSELPLVRALAGEEVRDVEMFVRNPRIPDGVFIAVTATPLLDEGKSRGAVAVFRDVTGHRQVREAQRFRDMAEQHREEKRRVAHELEQLRERLVRSTRLSAIGQMAASIAHELRNPLGAIGNAEFYLRQRVPPDQPKWGEYLGIIEEEIRAADRIISNLLDVSRAKPPRKQVVDLGVVAREAFDRVPRKDDVELRLSLDEEPFTVHADPGQLQQVLGNLFANAVAAMPSGGAITVEARRDTGSDRIRVQDTGPGVPDELVDRIFEPLFTTRAEGTGLGLAICRQVVERHDGCIDVAGGDDGGATFVVRLPNLPAGTSLP